MRPIHFLTIFAICSVPAFANAGGIEADIKTHPATGSVDVVDGAKAWLVSSNEGIAGQFTTRELKPGHVYTMWVAIMNKPENCELKAADHCTSADVIKRADKVDSDVTYGDGVVIGSEGTATFRTFVPAGKLGYSWLGNSLKDPTGAEIHFALHDHGPMMSDNLAGMLTTARAGCTDESLPKIWPDSARASGTSGPNKCQMAQFAILKQK